VCAEEFGSTSFGKIEKNHPPSLFLSDDEMNVDQTKYFKVIIKKKYILPPRLVIKASIVHRVRPRIIPYSPEEHNCLQWGNL
jgi:hypothetical protein